MRIVVTGGAGFIGSRVVARLRDRGEQVVALVRDPAKAPRLDGLGAELVADDLSDPARVREHLEAADAVIHAAGLYRIGITADERPAMWDANVGTTTRLLEAAEAAKVPRIVYVSTVNVFGNTDGRIVDESYRRDLALGFVSTYDETKFRAHEVAERRIEAGAPIVIAMPGTVVGPGDHTVLGEQLVQAYRGRLRYVAAAGIGVAPAHVDDVAAGITAAFARGEARPPVCDRGRLHPVRRGAPDRGRGRRADAAETPRLKRGPEGHGAVRAAHRAAECAGGRLGLGRRYVLGVVAAGEGRAGLRAAGRRHGHPRHARERLTYTRPMARELPMFDPTPGHHAPSPSEISIAMGGGTFGPAADGTIPLRRHPDWIKARMPSGDNYHDLKGLLRGLNLNTVCEEARCPNIGDCWDQRTATVMILGDVCTRACGFCAIKTGKPTWFDDDEPRRVAEAVAEMRLEHVVVTSVARDDLPDGGAGAFAATIRELRHRSPGMGVEVLIPDFNGAEQPLRTVMEAGPDILNHNLETVRRLQKPVRKRARWDRTLGVLERAKVYANEYGHAAHTKSSLMVGLGETREELTEAFEALREVDVDILTIGQYLRPTEQHLPLIRYYHPDEFVEMKTEALALGFKHVESGPLVRSSYHARDQVPGAELKALRRQATIDADGRVVPAAG